MDNPNNIGDMKIVIRYVPIPKFKKVAHCYVKNLLNALDLYEKVPNLSFKLYAHHVLGDPREGGDYRIEFNLDVMADDLPKNFVFILKTFLEYTKKVEEIFKRKFNESLCVTYVVKNDAFFNMEFEAAHCHLQTKEFHFGHIVPDSKFYSHKKQDIVLSHLEILHRQLDPAVSMAYPKDTIFTSLEHDRKTLIVRFPFQFKDPKYDGAVVNLLTRYSNFRRIIFDIEEHKVENTEKKKHRTRYEMKIYFHLIYPMTVKMFKFFKDKKYNPHDDRDRFNYGDAHPNWENNGPTSRQSLEINESPTFMIHLKPMEASQCAKIVGRLFVAAEHKIEFRHLAIIDFPILNRIVSPMSDTIANSYWFNRLLKETKFSFRYLLCALLSRGSVVKDQILRTEEERDEFLEALLEEYKKEKLLTLEAMERLLGHVDESLEVGNLTVAFLNILEKMIADSALIQQIFEDNKKEGFVRVRKIVITPTRILYVAPELIMSNRVLRKYDLDGEKALRVLFRDDDGMKIQSNHLPPIVIEATVGHRLKNGLEVAGRKFVFLGSSNSQMRDNGCYFFNGELEEILKIRKDLGKFKIQSVPKIMSRIGQCFTQAKEVQVELQRENYNSTYDYIGGADRNGKPYTYSDGVGVISYAYAKNIAKKLDIYGFSECVPTCFQIRFRGFKGVMSIDLEMDEQIKWARSNEFIDEHRSTNKMLYLCAKFRPSQEKFRGPRQTTIEIVKHSAPVAVSLNKPLINILDQVSEMQSRESHKRISNRIHWLLDKSLNGLTRCLIDEQTIRNKLKEFPKLLVYEKLNDFCMTQEPFFRSMVQAAARCDLKRILTKLQIHIPTSLGRSLFGVVDETGELQYGQVFVRYTKNSSLKYPGKNSERITHIGPIFITKNPCIVPGDIRMFEAVDIVGLRHLSDVVVFPRWGPRPHPDEMAGSDLDGDEYTVIWDEQLFINRNEPAFDFTPEVVEPDVITEKILPLKMCEFYVKYMEQDSIGKIANAFIGNADQFGINSKVCNQIAIKHNKAVDFPKTGIAPPLLTNKWSPDGETPPEKCERWADFMEKPHAPSYASTRLIGQLYRRVKVIDDLLKTASKESEQFVIKQDEYIDYVGWEKYEVRAQMEYESYAANLRQLMDSYSIGEEGELFSSCFVSLKNRVSDKEQDDMSLYNTTTMIEQRLAAIFGSYRKQFFENEGWGSFNELTQIEDNQKSKEHKEVFRRVCLTPNEEMKQKAVAFYKIAYDQDPKKGKRFLSFGWIAWDIINIVRSELLRSQLGFKNHYGLSPIGDLLSKHMFEFIQANLPLFAKFCTKMIDESAMADVFKRYCEKYEGLAQLLYFCSEWGLKHSLFNDSFTLQHLCLIVILYGLNRLDTMNFDSSGAWLEQIDYYQQNDIKIDLNLQRGGIGQKFLSFIEFLSTRQFEKMSKLDFTQAGLNFFSFFMEQEWMPLHTLALKTFNQIAFTNKFELLPYVEGLYNIKKTDKEAARVEAEPFVIEIPYRSSNTINSSMIERLKKSTGCHHIVFRRLQERFNKDSDRIMITSYGTIEANQKLKDLLTIRLNINSSISPRGKAILLMDQVYEKLLNL